MSVPSPRAPETLRGLSPQEAERRFATDGPNSIEEKKENIWSKMFRLFVSPISFMLLAASALSFFLGRWFDGGFILVLWAINAATHAWYAHRADTALNALRAQLEIMVRVHRGNAWRSVPARMLVRGDVVECWVGSMVPADLSILEQTNVQINEAILTGESLPKEKKTGDTAYAGSVVTTGILRGVVTATGNRTFFGKIVGGADTTYKYSTMERDIFSIAKFLMGISIFAVLLLTITLLLRQKPLSEILLLDLSLLIAGLPVSLPTVMTLIVSFGSVDLAGKSVLLRRLSALEDLANVNLLLTDKTGTLTENSIRVEKIISYGKADEMAVIRFAVTGLAEDGRSLIDQALLAAAADRQAVPSKARQFIPADSIRKHATAISTSDDNKDVLSATGAAPVVFSFCDFTPDQRAVAERDAAAAEKGGSRVIAVAKKMNPSGMTDEHGMMLLGLVVLSDPLRSDAADMISFLQREGVVVKMMTGDARETASRVARLLGIPGQVVSGRETPLTSLSTRQFARTGVFAEVLPNDKLALVSAAEGAYVVAMTGDGVNDLPAVRQAQVGIAVASAVDALKGAADIVLVQHGISVIRDAFLEARKIFARLWSYSIYRISESFRLILTILLLGFLYADYPLTTIQLILLALFNDIPIITLAFDRVTGALRPADVSPRRRFIMGTLFGLVGLANSLSLFFLLRDGLHLSWPQIQTAFFLKLLVSGHLLIYVAHTERRWYRFLPSLPVIVATSLTQGIATLFAIVGFFVAPISWKLALFVWAWAFIWMQVTELVKAIHARLARPTRKPFLRFSA